MSSKERSRKTTKGLKSSFSPSVLESSRKKQRSPDNKSSFVACPICNVNIHESKINIHLDSCTSSSSTSSINDVDHDMRMKDFGSKQNSKKMNPVATTRNMDADFDVDNQTIANDNNKSGHKVGNGHGYEIFHEYDTSISNACTEQKKTPSSSMKRIRIDKSTASAAAAAAANDNNQEENIFAHMMNHAKRRSTIMNKRIQRLHLHNVSGKVTFSYEDSNPDKTTTSCTTQNNDDSSHNHHQNNEKVIEWSTSVMIKEEQRRLKQPQEDQKMELMVSSSIPSFTNEYDNIHSTQVHSSRSNDRNTTMTPHFLLNTPKKLVMKPSRLSVPVLKSCLQKAIRRKRPLPAVRCAMELMDKSFQDLIRRLPIIILEDSFLHPDYPFLIWLMIAYSKDYVPPLSLIMKVLRIVFEVAFCSWKDDDSNDDYNGHGDNSDDTNDREHKKNDDSNDRSYTTAKQKFHSRFESNERSLSNHENLILKSFYLRKMYGGMKCDIQMMDEFINKWYYRFQNQNVSEDIANRCFNGKTVTWIDVPYLLHENVSRDSDKVVTPLLAIIGEKTFTALSINDVTPSGIDFHCSNVLHHILSDPMMYNILCDRLSSTSGFDGSSLPIHKGIDGKITKDSIMNVLKSCMWRFSSGVNYKRSFAGNEKGESCEGELYHDIWKSVVAPRVHSFAAMYISSRLSG